MPKFRYTRVIAPLVLIALLCAIVACSIRWRTPPPPKRALDTILLCENSPEAGPLRFAHRRHYAAISDGGAGIPCQTCHHDYKPPSKTVPNACRECHASHGQKSEVSKSPL